MGANQACVHLRIIGPLQGNTLDKSAVGQWGLA